VYKLIWGHCVTAEDEEKNIGGAQANADKIKNYIHVIKMTIFKCFSRNEMK
jgi:hypothetical protein